jgi:hypothetical protein
MTRICPRCGNPNDDAVKFCTSCGNTLIPQVSQPLTNTIQSTGPAMPAAPPGRNSTLMIIAVVAVAIIAIIVVLNFLQVSGIFRIFPSATPAVTPQVTPTITSYLITETPRLETTIPLAVISPASTNVTESPVTSLATTKPLVCPSDRFACGGGCRNLMTDSNNCGGCNISCTLTEICQQGHCMIRCSYSETSCTDGCHDLMYDTQNCGVCGNACPTGLVCNRSLCSLPLVTTIQTYTG